MPEPTKTFILYDLPIPVERGHAGTDALAYWRDYHQLLAMKRERP
jgi:hypothetical protein